MLFIKITVGPAGSGCYVGLCTPRHIAKALASRWLRLKSRKKGVLGKEENIHLVLLSRGVGVCVSGVISALWYRTLFFFQ